MTNKFDPPKLEPILSPCKLICSIDRKSGHCFGCGRTIEEISKWSSYSSADRKKIMEILPERMEAFE